jgi:hypothetical protein
VPLVLAFGLVVLVAAQSFIGGLTAGGEGGLGAFLRDGRGYSKSAFKLDPSNRAASSDPLPWLKLPRLDYVEVAGQEARRQRPVRERRGEVEGDGQMRGRGEILDRLRGLQDEMEKSLGTGDYEEAERLRVALSGLISDNSAWLAGDSSPGSDEDDDQDEDQM